MSSTLQPPISSFFFFNDTATTEIYTLSLHDALPILGALVREATARQRRLQRVDPDLVQANLPHRATLRERGRHGRDARRACQEDDGERMRGEVCMQYGAIYAGVRRVGRGTGQRHGGIRACEEALDHRLH